MKTIFPAEAHQAYLNALTALEVENSSAFFDQLSRIFAIFSRNEELKRRNFQELLQELADQHIKQLTELSDQAIAFYQNMLRAFSGFSIIRATLLMSLLQKRNQENENYLQFFGFITPGTIPYEPTSTNSFAFFAAQRNLHCISVAAQMARVFLPEEISHRPIVRKAQNTDGRAFMNAAMDSFSEIFASAPNSNLPKPSLENLADYYWKTCILNLNEQNPSGFYCALAQLTECILSQLVASNRKISPAEIRAVFSSLHEKHRVHTSNFCQPLTHRGLNFYNQLYKSYFSNQHQNPITAPAYFFSLLLPVNQGYLGIPIQNTTPNKFNIEEIQTAYETDKNSHIQKIREAKKSYLIALKMAVQDPHWQQEGKTAAAYLFPWLNSCSALGRKTPRGISKLRASLKNLDPNCTEEFSNTKLSEVKSALFASQHRSRGRSEKTAAFYEQQSSALKNLIC